MFKYPTRFVLFLENRKAPLKTSQKIKFVRFDIRRCPLPGFVLQVEN